MPTIFKSLLLLLAIAGLASCKSSAPKNAFTQEAGLFKVAILYPGGEGKFFDMAYYEKTHMPLVAAYLGKNLKYYEIDRGVSGRSPEEQAPYVAVGYFYVYDLGAYHQAIAQNREPIVGDIKNYTNILPTVQISEIKKLAYYPGK